MIKFYKNMTDYAKQNKMHRNTASKKFKNWELDLIEIPKGAKWIDKKSMFWSWRWAPYQELLDNPRTEERMYTDEEIEEALCPPIHLPLSKSEIEEIEEIINNK